MTAATERHDWPTLPLESWQQTRDTLHLYSQVVGKIRLVLSPPEREWAHCSLFLTARGLTTSPIPYGDDLRTFEIDFDFIDHALIVKTSEGAVQTIPLVSRTVSAFYRLVLDTVAGLGIDVTLNPKPQEIPGAIPFPDDTVHATYDPAQANRFWRVLARIDAVFKEFRASYRGRHSAVHFFWGSFDLAYSRYSGLPADPPPGADLIFRGAMDAVEVAFGFWPGDARFPEPAFYAYAYPKPNGIDGEKIAPAQAFWSPELGEFILRYRDAIAADSPSAAILDFLESTYSAGSAHWDRSLPG